MMLIAENLMPEVPYEGYDTRYLKFLNLPPLASLYYYHANEVYQQRRASQHVHLRTFTPTTVNTEQSTVNGQQ